MIYTKNFANLSRCMSSGRFGVPHQLSSGWLFQGSYHHSYHYQRDGSASLVTQLDSLACRTLKPSISLDLAAVALYDLKSCGTSPTRNTNSIFLSSGYERLAEISSHLPWFTKLYYKPPDSHAETLAMIQNSLILVLGTSGLCKPGANLIQPNAE